MKKILFLLTFAAGITATAQVKVGTNPTTLATNAQFQVEGTTTADQFVVLKNGNVGIGTTAPTAKLDVNGTLNVNPASGSSIYTPTWPSNADGEYFSLVLNANGTDNRKAPKQRFQGSTNSKFMDIGLKATDNSFVIQSFTHNILTAQQEGNVGIGTTAPVSRLDVKGNARFSTDNALNETNPLLIVTGNANTDKRIYVLTGAIEIQSNETTLTNPIFRVNHSGVDRITALANGNVGIGTTAPNAPLQFANTTVNRKIVLHDIANNDNQFYGLGINSGVLRYQIAAVDNKHIFYAGASATTSNELMTIQGNGNVGIGTTAPNASAALEVESTTKGILPPRMTNAQAYAIATPATGLMVYNTTLKCLSYFDGTTWNCTYVTPQPAPATAPLGSTFTTRFNGVVSGTYTGTATTVTHSTGETFNNLSGCAAKMISAGNTSCPASVTGVSGTVYPLQLINGQCWMTTNLKEIPTNFSSNSPTSWLATNPGDQGYSGYYNTTDTSGASGWALAEPAANEGLIYQWSAAMNNSMTERAKGICPTGYHIPSDCEWSFLEHGLGMSLSENALFGAWRDNTAGGGNVGSKTRSQGTGNNNASGFAALLSGSRRASTGTFNNRTAGGLWWSSSASGASDAFYRVLLTGNAGVERGALSKAFGFSVRCLKD